MIAITESAVAVRHRERDSRAAAEAAPSGARRRAGELSWTLAGKLAMVAGNAALMLFLGNRLPLEPYGLLVAVIAAQILLSRIVMVGVDIGMIRLAAADDLRHRSPEIARAGLVVIAFGSGIVTIAVLVAAAVSTWSTADSWALTAIGIGAVGTALVDYAYALRLSALHYRAAAAVQGGTAVGRLALTGLTAAVVPDDHGAVFLTYAVTTFASGLAHVAAAIRGRTARLEASVVRRLLGYSLWVGLANIVVVVSLYEGTFLLTLLEQRAATGVFGLGLMLSMGFFAVYTGFFEYLLSRIDRANGVKAVRRFVVRSTGAALLLVAGCVPLAAAGGAIVPRIVPPELSIVVPIFAVLSASMFLLIVQAPFEAACHYLLRPRVVLLGWVVRVLAIGVGSLVLAPTHGALGVAAGYLGGSTVALGVLSVIVVAGLSRAHRKSAALVTVTPNASGRAIVTIDDRPRRRG